MGVALALVRKETTMKETARESAALKRAFKDHFTAHGIDAPLPPDLQAESEAFPLEYGEACDEFEKTSK